MNKRQQSTSLSGPEYACRTRYFRGGAAWHFRGRARDIATGASLGPRDDGLIQALPVDGPAGEHADRLMLFGCFVGSLQLEWSGSGPDAQAAMTGELHSGWVSGGRAVQDIWIVPGRGPPGEGHMREPGHSWRAGRLGLPSRSGRDLAVAGDRDHVTELDLFQPVPERAVVSSRGSARSSGQPRSSFRRRAMREIDVPLAPGSACRRATRCARRRTAASAPRCGRAKEIIPGGSSGGRMPLAGAGYGPAGATES